MMLAFTIAVAALNMALKLAGVFLCSRMLKAYKHRLNHRQRGGLSLAGGGCLLTVPLALDPTSGLNLWSPVILVAGLLLFLWGSMDRLWIHEQARRDAIDQAQTHFEGTQG